MALATDVVVIAGRGFTVTLNGFDPETWVESVAVAVNPKVTGAVTAGARPVNCPPLLSDSHDGSPLAVNEYEPVPPLAANVAE